MRRILNGKKVLIVTVICLILSIFSITLAYSLLRTTLKIDGKGEFTGHKFDVHFENIQEIPGSIKPIKPATITATNKINYEIKFTKPGDYYEFCFDVVNDSSFDVAISKIDTNYERYNYSAPSVSGYIMKYKNGDEIKEGDILLKNTATRFYIRELLRSDINNSYLDELPVTFDSYFKFTYEQVGKDYVPPTDAHVGDPIRNTPPESSQKLVRVISGTGNNFGDEIAIKNEHFYVMSSDATTIKLLAKYNLFIKNSESDYYNGTFKQVNEATNLQHDGSEFKIIFGVGNSYGTYGYSESQIVKFCGIYQEMLENFGAEIYNVRVPTEVELQAFGCTGVNTVCSNGSGYLDNASFWLYNKKRSDTGYYYDASTNKIASATYRYSWEAYGVRPLVIIPKSILNK